MSVEVIADLGSGAFKIQEKPLDWCCVECLCPVLDTNAGFYECECGPSFVVSIVAYGQNVILVQPEVPCFEPEPEA